MIIKLLAKQSVAQNRGVAQFGSARGLGPWGREFESLHPDQRRYTDGRCIMGLQV